jgi:uncharacterized protein YjiS (DUF1127 family)
MSSDITFAPHSGADMWPAAAAASAKPVGIWRKIADLPTLVGTWRERLYFRRELMRLVKDGPELIDDIGLTMRQVDDEIAKPFWQA